MTPDQKAISIHVTQELLEQLQTYQTQHEIETTADAVTTILTHFFEAGSSASGSFSRSSTSRPAQAAIFQTDDDDIEDEPDEILWDFLPDEDQL
ncbi:MAG TPA: hypothetical protein V6C78_05850 [Crinalium sp.]|jgi:hypothetical protein